MPRKPQNSATSFSLLDPSLRAKVDVAISAWNAEHPQSDPMTLASFMRAALRSALAGMVRVDDAIIDETLLAEVSAHVKKINTSHPDDPYDVKRFVRVSVRKAMRSATGNAITSPNKRAVTQG